MIRRVVTNPEFYDQDETPDDIPSSVEATTAEPEVRPWTEIDRRLAEARYQVYREFDRRSRSDHVDRR